MELYRVIIKPSVEKDFRGLPKNILAKVFSAIKNLAEDLFQIELQNSKERIEHIEFESAIIESFMRLKKSKKQSRFCMLDIAGKFIEIIN